MKKYLIILITLMLLLTSCGGERVQNPQMDESSSVNDLSEDNSSKDNSSKDNSSEDNISEDNSSEANDKKDYVILEHYLYEGANYVYADKDINAEYVIVKVIIEWSGQLKLSSNDDIGLLGDGQNGSMLQKPSPEIVNSKELITPIGQNQLVVAIKSNRQSEYILNVEKYNAPYKDPSGVAINGITYYFENEDIENIWKLGSKAHDYCVCGTKNYVLRHTTAEVYQDQFVTCSGFADYLVKNGIISKEALEEYYEKTEKVDAKLAYRERLPSVYRFIRHFNISKADYLKYREYAIDMGKKTDIILGGLYTDKEIEILFGDYSKEVVMRECMNPTSYYYDGKLYFFAGLSWLDEQTLKTLLEQEDFNLWLYDMRKLGPVCGIYNTTDIFNRIETLRAEMEAQ